jgi:hypothetical protein
VALDALANMFEINFLLHFATSAKGRESNDGPRRCRRGRRDGSWALPHEWRCRASDAAHGFPAYAYVHPCRRRCGLWWWRWHRLLPRLARPDPLRVARRDPRRRAESGRLALVAQEATGGVGQEATEQQEMLVRRQQEVATRRCCSGGLRANRGRHWAGTGQALCTGKALGRHWEGTGQALGRHCALGRHWAGTGQALGRHWAGTWQACCSVALLFRAVADEV